MIFHRCAVGSACALRFQCAVLAVSVAAMVRRCAIGNAVLSAPISRFGAVSVAAIVRRCTVGRTCALRFECAVLVVFALFDDPGMLYGLTQLIIHTSQLQPR